MPRVKVLFLLAAILFGSDFVSAQPPQAPRPPQAPPIVVPPCDCGCMEGKNCGCKNCCERTASPTWREAQKAQGYGPAAGSVPQSATVIPTVQTWDQVVGADGLIYLVPHGPTPGQWYGTSGAYSPGTVMTGSYPLEGFYGASGGCAGGSCGGSAVQSRGGFFRRR